MALGKSHQDVDEQLQNRIFRLFCEHDVKLVAQRRRAGLPLFLRTQNRSQPVDPGLVDMLGGQRGRQRLEHQARVEQVVESGSHVLEIDHDGASGRPGVGLADEQPAVGSTTHSGHLMVLDKAHRLAQHRSAHAIALLQRTL